MLNFFLYSSLWIWIAFFFFFFLSLASEWRVEKFTEITKFIHRTGQEQGLERIREWLNVFNMTCLLDSKVETLDRILNMNMNLRKIKIGNYHHANKYTAIISERRVFSITTCIQISKGFTAWCAQKPILWHWPLRKEKAYWKTDWQGDRRRGSNPSPWWCIISGYLRVRVLKW